MDADLWKGSVGQLEDTDTYLLELACRRITDKGSPNLLQDQTAGGYKDEKNKWKALAKHFPPQLQKKSVPQLSAHTGRWTPLRWPA